MILSLHWPLTLNCLVSHAFLMITYSWEIFFKGISGLCKFSNEKKKEKKLSDIEEVLSTSQTTSNGNFEIEGDTVGRKEQDIAPMVRFYHRCDDDLKKDLKKVSLIKIYWTIQI